LKRKKDKAAPRELFAYDGHDFIGKIMVGKNGRALALDAAGKTLGRFRGFKAAFWAISSASIAAAEWTEGGNSAAGASKRAVVNSDVIGVPHGHP
jgi:hypothetical protein